MNLCVVGTGYVGLVTGACFSEMGNSVTCVDKDNYKIDQLKNGQIPIYEPGLKKIVEENYKENRLHFTTEISEGLNNSKIIFIAVGTPMRDDGSANLEYVLQVAKEIGQNITNRKIVVDKSTVPVGTADKVRATIKEELTIRDMNIKFEVVSNPEFLKEGSAVDDFMKPERVVVGADSEKTMETMKELYRPYTMNHERFIGMDVRSAEMTKYAANSMLATKISFMNEIARICEKVGADVNKVRVGIGSDSRIGYDFIYPGTGYGGSCFPKDVRALINTSEENGINPKILTAVDEVNNEQKRFLVEKVKNKFGNELSNLTFAIWGLSFKPGTDDMREAPSITVIKELTNSGAKIKAYDPKAIEQAKNIYLKEIENIEYYDSKYDALDDSQALLLVTEWKEFRSPDFNEVKKRLDNPIIFDGRNQYKRGALDDMGIEYHYIGGKSK